MPLPSWGQPYANVKKSPTFKERPKLVHKATFPTGAKTKKRFGLQTYTTKLYSDGFVYCNCAGWRYKTFLGRWCKHVEQIIGTILGKKE